MMVTGNVTNLDEAAPPQRCRLLLESEVGF